MPARRRCPTSSRMRLGERPCGVRMVGSTDLRLFLAKGADVATFLCFYLLVRTVGPRRAQPAHPRADGARRASRRRRLQDGGDPDRHLPLRPSEPSSTPGSSRSGRSRSRLRRRRASSGRIQPERDHRRPLDGLSGRPSPWSNPASAPHELALEHEVHDQGRQAAMIIAPAASRLLSEKNWPCRLLSAEVIGRLSPVNISTRAQKKSL